MSKNKVIRSVSFNISKENDRECLEHIKNLNFSGYVKELILSDIKKNKRRIQTDGKGGIKIVLN